MKNRMMQQTEGDYLLIKELKIRGFIGVSDQEKQHQQKLLVDIKIFLKRAITKQTQMLHHTVDYEALSIKVQQVFDEGTFYLIESLAYAITEMCLAIKGVSAVEVVLQKPTALTQARYAATYLYRKTQ